MISSTGGVERRKGVSLDETFGLDNVLAEGFDAILLAPGLSRSVPLPVSERPATGVAGAIEFLAAAKRGAKSAGTVLVIGGGNTAIDAALSAKHAGADDVSIVYRRSFAEMPAWPEERDSAIREGVNFLVLTQPIGYLIDETGKLTGLKVIRTHLGAPGVDGRRRPEPSPGSEHVIAADFVVEAIGQKMDESLRQALTGVEFSKGGLISTAPDSMATSRKGVYAAGDIVNGGTTVVQAVAEGVKAAREIDTFLRN